MCAGSQNLEGTGSQLKEHLQMFIGKILNLETPKWNVHFNLGTHKHPAHSGTLVLISHLNQAQKGETGKL